MLDLWAQTNLMINEWHNILSFLPMIIWYDSACNNKNTDREDILFGKTTIFFSTINQVKYDYYK